MTASILPAARYVHHPDPEAYPSNYIDQVSRKESQDQKRILALFGTALSQLPIWGFAMCYGVLQEYHFEHWKLKGNRKITGIIGTTSNGVMYISMPFLFALFTGRWARYRQLAASCGALIACTSFILSAFSRNVWHLVASQGVFAALGCALLYSPITLSLGEWFNSPNRICNRAVAYGICISIKDIVGSACPFVFRGLLDRYDFRVTMLMWAVITAGASILSIMMVTTPQSVLNSSPGGRKIPWQFLCHKMFWTYSIATLLQSAGYGIPQTYISEYARNVSALSPSFSTLLLSLINIPGICSSTFFGFLSDNKQFKLSAPTAAAISAIGSSLSTFIFWGLAAQDGIALLVLFAILFGFFAGGYSATWGGAINDLESDSLARNESVDSGVLYGLLNGARGIGYVALIVFTGISLAFGGCGVIFRPWWKKMIKFNIRSGGEDEKV